MHQEIPHLFGNVIHRTPLQLQMTLPGETQQLLHQLRCPLPRLLRRGDQRFHPLWMRLLIHLCQGEIPNDSRQQVVEIMRHPTRQPPDRLHLLCLPQSIL